MSSPVHGQVKALCHYSQGPYHPGVSLADQQCCAIIWHVGKYLDEGPTGEAGAADGFGGLASNVGARAVHLGGVLAGEGAASVRAPAAVGVDDDLAPGEPGVAMGASDHKAACAGSMTSFRRCRSNRRQDAPAADIPKCHRMQAEL